MRPMLPAVALAATALSALAVPALPARAAPAQATAAAPGIAAVLADPRRDKDRARDVFRHPAETLKFFRIEPGMTVVDYVPMGGGWYTRVLVPYLGEQGRYVALIRYPREAEGSETPDTPATFADKAAGWTGVPATRLSVYALGAIPKDAAGTVDRAIIMRDMHNMLRGGTLYRDLKDVRMLLKPNGLLGIEQHRAKANASADYTDGSKGYMREKDVIALVEAMGFELVDRSEINANPRDTADYPGGVWTLPPVLSQGPGEGDRYKSIGESDRMTLLFRKRP